MSRITHDKEIAGRGNKKKFRAHWEKVERGRWARLDWVAGPLSLVVLKVLMLLKLFLEIDAQGLTLAQTKKHKHAAGAGQEDGTPQYNKGHILTAVVGNFVFPTAPHSLFPIPSLFLCLSLSLSLSALKLAGHIKQTADHTAGS